MYLFCTRCKKDGHHYYRCPTVGCRQCRNREHNVSVCLQSRCYNCSEYGHIRAYCNKRETWRMEKCWRCHGYGHDRFSRHCPGSRVGLRCSYCSKPGSTEMCPCNQVDTTNLPETRIQKMLFENNVANEGIKWVNRGRNWTPME